MDTLPENEVWCEIHVLLAELFLNLSKIFKEVESTITRTCVPEIVGDTVVLSVVHDEVHHYAHLRAFCVVHCR